MVSNTKRSMSIENISRNTEGLLKIIQKSPASIFTCISVKLVQWWGTKNPNSGSNYCCFIWFQTCFISGCKGSFHEGCRIKAELPCIARKETPKSQASKGRRLRLGDYCPDSRPMVPPLIAYCTLHLDRNPSSDNPYNGEGWVFVIFYYPIKSPYFRVKSEMEDILRIFQKTRAFPKLDRYSHHSIAGTIKMFLSQIRVKYNIFMFYISSF